MKLEVLPDKAAAAARAADSIAEAMTDALAHRGRFLLAASGGREPWAMYRRFAAMPLDWTRLFLLQVDERVAPDGHEERNLTHLRAHLIEPAGLAPGNVLPMPVEAVDDLERAAARYAEALTGLAGAPPVIDFVHLGLGADGHTASLVPGDPALEVSDEDVTLSGPYGGLRRMTLTLPAINRARRRLWLVVGESKAPMLARLMAGDEGLPCGRVRRDDTVVVTDEAAVQAL